jgi:hypothetical protein
LICILIHTKVKLLGIVLEKKNHYNFIFLSESLKNTPHPNPLPQGEREQLGHPYLDGRGLGGERNL